MALSFMIPWSIDGTGSYILFFIWVGNNAHDKMKQRATARRAWLQHDSVWHSTGTQRVQFFLERFFFSSPHSRLSLWQASRIEGLGEPADYLAGPTRIFLKAFLNSGLKMV